MLEENKDYLRHRARQLDLGRADTLVLAQKLLDELYPSQTKAVSLNDHTLKITTANASVAGELRLRQVELRDRLIKLGVITNRLQINISGS